MHTYTISHRIASLPTRVWHIIWVSLTLTCFTTLAEAKGRFRLPLHFDIIKTNPSPNYNSRIRYMIIQRQDAAEYANKTGIDGARAAHYVVSRTKNKFGQIIIHQTLSEDEYVQGLTEARWGSRYYINTFSIILTVLDATDEKGGRSFLPEQVHALAALVQDIAQRHEIPANAVLDLSDVMAGSITSTSFDWENLHKEWHIGPWPNEEDVADALHRINTSINNKEETTGALHATDTSMDRNGEIDKKVFLRNLALYGYPVPCYGDEDENAEVIQKVIASFQRHFRPTKCDGQTDMETVAILEALIKKYGTQPIYFKHFIN